MTEKAKRQEIDEDEENNKNIELVIGLFLMKEIEMFNFLEVKKRENNWNG
jgi:hypothetical protein